MGGDLPTYDQAHPAWTEHGGTGTKNRRATNSCRTTFRKSPANRGVVDPPPVLFLPILLHVVSLLPHSLSLLFLFVGTLLIGSRKKLINFFSMTSFSLTPYVSAPILP